jgi:hypothetical protein
MNCLSEEFVPLVGPSLSRLPLQSLLNQFATVLAILVIPVGVFCLARVFSNNLWRELSIFSLTYGAPTVAAAGTVVFLYTLLLVFVYGEIQVSASLALTLTHSRQANMTQIPLKHTLLTHAYPLPISRKPEVC